MKTTKRMWMLVLFASVAGLLTLAGCNTSRGIGEDVEDTGEAIQDAAR